MRVSLIALAVSAALAGPSVANAQGVVSGKITAQKTITNLPSFTKSTADEPRRYLVSLNPFVVADHVEQAKQRRTESRTAEPAAPVQTSIKELGDELAKKYGFDIDSRTVWSTPTFETWLTKKDAEKLLAEDAVTGIQEVRNDPLQFSQAVSGDLTIGNEVLSWAKLDINTNDGITTSNNFYLVDATLGTPTVTSELNVISRSDLADFNPYSKLHSTFVAGLVGARSNNAVTRGINPNMPIKAFGVGGADTASIASRIEAAMGEAEWTNDFAVANISMNYPPNSDNEFRSNGVFGRLLRSASNRLFFTQSAGNYDGDACGMAYNYNGNARQNDGIMVVGALTRQGSRMISGSNPYPGGVDPVLGSNYGKCVEAWAPGHEITSLDPDGNLRNSTGTSYSAPIVAAVAARYGNSQSRPLERENYIRSILQNTGYSEAGYPLQKVYYQSPASYNFPKRLSVSTIYASHNTNLNTMFDGRFYNEYWNAGANFTSLTVDLGSVRNVTGVRLTIRSSAATNDGVQKPINFGLWGAASVPADTFLLNYQEPDQSDLAPIYIGINPMNTRYITIEANNPYSWMAYSEIEVYGH